MKNRFKIISLFFVILVLICGMGISVSASDNYNTCNYSSLCHDGGITYYNNSYKSYCLYEYNGEARIVYSASAHYFKYNAGSIVSCASNGSYLSYRYLSFPTVDDALTFLVDYDNYTPPGETFNAYYNSGSYAISCDYTTILYNNVPITSDQSGNVIIKDVDAAALEQDDRTIFEQIIDWFTFDSTAFNSFKVQVDETNSNSSFITTLTDFASRLKNFYSPTQYAGYASESLMMAPSVKIPLSDYEGSFGEGFYGNDVSVNFAWFNRWRPTFLVIESCFLWVFFIWRMYIRLPDIIRGSGAVINNAGSVIKRSDN